MARSVTWCTCDLISNHGSVTDLLYDFGQAILPIHHMFSSLTFSISTLQPLRQGLVLSLYRYNTFHDMGQLGSVKMLPEYI